MKNVRPMPDPCTIDQLVFIKVNSFPRNGVTCILSVRNGIIISMIELRTLTTHNFLSILHDSPCQKSDYSQLKHNEPTEYFQAEH